MVNGFGASFKEPPNLYSAPILFTAQKLPAIQPLITRKFDKYKDRRVVLDALDRHYDEAMEKTDTLIRFHEQRAAEALLRMPESEARNALVRLILTSSAKTTGRQSLL